MQAGIKERREVKIVVCLESTSAISDFPNLVNDGGLFFERINKGLLD
jgi:hypothetical protein